MKKKTCFLMIGLASVLLAACSQNPKAPVAKQVPYVMEEFGGQRVDPYFWMRLSDEQKNAETPDQQTQDVLDYLQAENDYADAYFKPLKSLQETLYKEMTSRLVPDDASVPYKKGGYTYTTRYESGKDYPIYARTSDGQDKEEILLDVNELAEGQKYTGVTQPRVSPDNQYVAYGEDFVSRRIYTIVVKDLKSGKMLQDTLRETGGNLAWAADSKHIYYVGKDVPTLRNNRIYRHTLGQPQSQDELLWDETDETFSVHLQQTVDDKYILAVSSQTLTTDVRYIAAGDVKGSLKEFTPRTVGHKYSVNHIGNTFYILTDRDNSLNRKIMTVSDSELSAGKAWKDFLAYRPDVLIEDFALMCDYVIVNERINGLCTIRIMNPKKNIDKYLEFDEPCYVARLGTNVDPDSHVLRYVYQSMLTPSKTVDLNLETGEETVMKEQNVPGYDKSKYQEERIWATAKDGTKVPVDVITPKDFKKDGNAPLYLYAYGSYGSSTDPSFDTKVFSLLDRGFAYAIAHIRGGSDMGRQWYEDGKLFKKMNTFTDFNDCARYLIEQKYTQNDRLFARGASAGGLLIGACINLEPSLYKGVIAGVPFVDVVSTMQDETIPLTTFEWDEWGDPRQEDYYRYMLSYSPYDNVVAQDYPNILVTTGYWDSQVQYWEPAKWVAKLRANKTDKNVLLMRCDMASGHGGASGRFRRLEQNAMEYAFFLSLLN